MAGMDIYDLSRHLGHTTVKITEAYLSYVPGGSPVSRAYDLAHEGEVPDQEAGPDTKPDTMGFE